MYKGKGPFMSYAGFRIDATQIKSGSPRVVRGAFAADRFRPAVHVDDAALVLFVDPAFRSQRLV